MADRVVSIKLQADATGLVQGMGRARDAIGETKARVVDSAKSSREAWSTVGSGLTAVGVAVTGIGAAALSTGIQYNTLQQTTRAALSTLLGSASAANAQMDKLDAFARNSPFSKATFINAQQQMLAFGIEAKKVVPYLDAVQNAVAAAGGRNADIEGIVATMSKIQSSAKITAEDLNEFGGRGVNAAELIGSQMGKTGAQIREDITKGTIDAGQALDALAAGMSDTYAGAAENVKNTFEGSMDRVKAAWRDFSAELATPLVDPNGGGALVELLNWAADAMRAFEDLPGPVKTTVSVLTGLGGAASLGAGAAMLALPKWLEFKSALVDVGYSGSRLDAVMRGIGKGIAIGGVVLAASAALDQFRQSVEDATLTTTELQNALVTSGKAKDIVAEAFKGTDNIFDGFDINTEKATEKFGDFIDQVSGAPDMRWMGSLGTYLLALDPQADKARDRFAKMGDALSSMNAADAAASLAMLRDEYQLTDERMSQMLDMMPAFKDQLVSQATEMGKSSDNATLLDLALSGVASSQDAAAGSTTGATQTLEELAGVAATVTEGISKVADEIRNFGSAQIDADRAAIDLQDKIRALNDIFASGTASLDIYTEAGSKTQSAMLDIADGAREQAASIMNAGGAQSEANAILDSARQGLIDQRIALGENAADAEAWAARRVPTAAQVQQGLDNVKASAEAIPGNTNANVSTNADAASAQIDNFIAKLRSIPSPVSVDIRTRDALILSPQGIEEKYASGGTVGYASGYAVGGTIGLAAGGMVPGIGGGIASGTVFGQGTTTSDSVLVRLSKGEEVIRASEASKHRALLKQINAGQFSEGMTRGSFAPSIAAQTTVIERVHTETPTELTLVDTKGALIGTMQVVANREIDEYSNQMARERRRAGF
ncbi:tape measure protein [Leucobacter sp. L43]|uniref:tape measure protein n=1 Tax=Leucobacter sp. L43 TaxID=2798040 RepID=UPI0019041209|nr:tape measure protein [Leucobacter sp. L43]